MGRKITLDIIKNELKEIDETIEVIADEYKGCNKPLKCKCKICNKIWYPVWDNLKQGKGCMDCKRKLGNDRRRMTISDVKRRLKTISPNIQILSNKYICDTSKLDCKCKECQTYFKIDWHHLQAGQNCPKCTIERYKQSRKLNIEEIRQFIIKNNLSITLLSNNYVNAKQHLLFKCNTCHRKFRKTYTNLSIGQGCPKCGVQKRWDSRGRLTMKDVKSFVKNNYKNILIIDEIYDHAKAPIKCYCNICDYKFQVSFNRLKNGSHCPKCGIKNRSGINHPFYNNQLSEQDRVKERYVLNGKSHSNWSKEVYKRDWYRCAICGSKNKINAHHLNSYHTHVNERYDINNGITLCQNHHKDFHKQYGYRNNTKEQFEEYLKHAQ